MTIEHVNLLIGAFHQLPQNGCGTPYFTPNGRLALAEAARVICSTAHTLTDLVDAEFIQRLLGATAGAAEGHHAVTVYLKAARTRLTPAPVPPPQFTSWVIQYRSSGERHWSTCTEHQTYEDAYRDLPTHPRAGGEYRILGVTA